ncbi:hypothetical protein G3I18_11695 [Actinospica acidiphila]|uniref:Uncharacterized protein n=1 Tax=Actinospica acidiphila TaxID=304899 RepID=A0A9X5HC23_9ACTN|nr:hypothetical protein [Actinospica acidiphila]NEC49235.1 hypothetical protein [Actinospica acidiphila]
MTPRVLCADHPEAGRLPREQRPDERLLPPAQGPADGEGTGRMPGATDEEGTA